MTVVRLIIAGALLTACAGVAKASYVYSSIVDPSANGRTVAEAINNAGQIVGFYYDSATCSMASCSSAAATPRLTY